MTDFRTVTETFAVAPQIGLADVQLAKEAGFSLLINNRPDNEEATQPSSAQVEAAARLAGVDYVHIPVVGRPGAAQVEAMQAALAGARGKTLAFCRSGTRSITTWALGQAGRMDRAEIVRRGAAAGYDLAAILG